MQVADIQYRKGEIDKATKAVDFLNTRTNNIDPMGLYVKGVLEMEKNNRYEAKKYLQEAIKLTKYENHEILRCYGLCEYWYGNRTKGIEFLEYAFDLNNLDAEVIYNLIEIYLLEHRVKKAKSFIAYYQKNHQKLMTFDKQIEYYDAKISLFDQYVHINQKKKSL
jgi:tetratricopeptide (TPR) repeat protein